MLSRNMILRMVSFSLLISCSPSKQDIIGIYKSTIKENNIDSLYLFQNNMYKHSIYNVDGINKIYVQYGVWNYQNDCTINLKDFYNNDNELFKKYIKYDFQQYNMLVNTTVSKSFRKITIDINSDMGNVYVKLNNSKEKELLKKEYQKIIKLNLN